jgi:hypothetical protein
MFANYSSSGDGSRISSLSFAHQSPVVKIERDEANPRSNYSLGSPTRFISTTHLAAAPCFRFLSCSFW